MIWDIRTQGMPVVERYLTWGEAVAQAVRASGWAIMGKPRVARESGEWVVRYAFTPLVSFNSDVR